VLENQGSVQVIEVEDRDDDTVWVLNATTGATVKVLNLSWGAAPAGVVLTSVAFTPAD
jgi:hypothetical protein